MALMNSPLWTTLTDHAKAMAGQHLRQLFADDPNRFAALSFEWSDWLADFSKQRITPETLRLLQALWQEAEGPAWIARMRQGELINHTESRAALHFALRQAGTTTVRFAGRDITADILDVQARMEEFCCRVHAGEWCGATGRVLRDVVNIGIGGSDQGPRMATRALTAYGVAHLRVHYVSNVDGADLAPLLKRLDPATTLFIVASKTFTTEETLQNAHSARGWLIGALGEAAVPRHFVAVTAAQEKAGAFGIPPENVFAFWDWVGGRFSIWSAIGLPLALAIGFDNFLRFLAGGRAMDSHFFNAPVEGNLPLTLALLDLWNIDFLGAGTRAVLPYSQSLERLPDYLQQLEMESNGKRVDREGMPVSIATAPVVWGSAGTNGQHAFYQLIHQGGRLIPCEFLALREPDFPLTGHHARLLAHCFAQSQALMLGRTTAEAEAEALRRGLSPQEAHRWAPYGTFPGNQPSTTLLLPRMDPYTLGQLIALFEHKVFALGVLWGLNSFDQWGVEYGKQLAGQLRPALEGGNVPDNLDSSTAGLLAACRPRS